MEVNNQHNIECKSEKEYTRLDDSGMNRSESEHQNPMIHCTITYVTIINLSLTINNQSLKGGEGL